MQLVSCGYEHTLCLSSSGEVYGFGDNAEGQIGNGSSVKIRKIELLERITSISCGQSFSACVDANGHLFTLGSLFDTDYVEMKQVEFPSLFRSVHCGADYLICLGEERSLIYTMGQNKHGQLATGDTKKRKSLQTIKVNENIASASCLSFYFILVTEKNTLMGCGWNQFGQLGLQHQTTMYSITPNPFVSDVAMLSCGWNHSVVLNKEGRVLTAGNNKSFQLGRDGDGNSYQEVPNIPKIISISCGYDHTMCIDEEGYLWTFGDNINGQLGLGVPLRAIGTPTKVPRLNCIFVLSHGGDHSIVKDESGTIWGFGKNSQGQLGFQSETQCDSPQRLSEELSHIIGVPQRAQSKSARK